MALFYMKIQFYIILILGLICMMMVTLKNGKLLKNKFAVLFIGIATIIFGFINYSSLPSNYFAQKLLVIAVFVVTLVGLFLNNKYEGYERISKSFIAVGIMANMILLSL